MLIPDNFVKNKENVSQIKLIISSTFFLICVCLGVCVCKDNMYMTVCFPY